MAKRLDVGALLGAAVSDSNPMQVHDIPLAAIDENEDNRYDQRNIDELAESIQVVGLQQPLVVQANGERYLLIAGHRRRNALALLGRKTAPCIVLAADLDPSRRTLILHWTNTMARGGAGLTGSEVAGAAREIEAALVDLKQRGVVELPGKLREYVAGVLQVSEAALARAKAIDNHLTKAFRGDYKCQRIKDSVAYELSQCSEELQRELYDLYKGDFWQLDAKDVKAHKKAAAAGFAPLKCPEETYGVEPCVGIDKRAAAVKHGVCPGCCHDCDKADGCEWVCGRVSRKNRTRAEAEEQEAKRRKENDDFEASTLGKLRRQLQERLAAYGVHSARDLSNVVFCDWIWTDNPAAYYSDLSLSDLLKITDQIGIDLQELLFGNPVGAPLRELAQGIEQAAATPQVNVNSHVCVTGLSRYGICGAAQCCNEPYACCIACPKDCNGRCGWLPKATPQPAPVWHPYPAEQPDEEQVVLVRKSNGYYSALVYREGAWYLPEIPDSQMDVQVEWWSAALPPKTGRG